MATTRYYACNCEESACGKNLFSVLKDFVERKPCNVCGRPQDLHLIFDFKLDAGKQHCNVLAVFYRRKPVSWCDKTRRQVTFYPFLVILKRDGGKQSCWLPYWHIINESPRKPKYGQWAPFMGLTEFSSLLAQAHKAGYLRAAHHD